MIHQFDGQAFRQVMRHVPSPVAVLTYTGDDGPRGVTIGSFTSLSLSPPLVSFNLMQGKTSEDLIKRTYFGIHILRGDQGALSDHFALPDLSSAAQFGSINYSNTPEGVPALTNCLACLICSIYDAISAGDHSLILGNVLQATLVDPSNPLIYCQRAYHEISATDTVNE